MTLCYVLTDANFTTNLDWGACCTRPNSFYKGDRQIFRTVSGQV